MNVRGEIPPAIESFSSDGLPNVFAENLGIELEIPDDFKGIALGVVVHAYCRDDRIDAGSTDSTRYLRVRTLTMSPG